MSGNMIIGIITLYLLGGVSCHDEKRLYNHLLQNAGPFDILARPVSNYSSAIDVTLGVTLQQLIDVDEKNQVIETNMWLTYKWNNSYFSWNPKEFGGVQSIRIPPHYMWVPDVLLYNSVGESFNSLYPSNVIVNNDGSLEWIPPGIIKSTCKIDITWFPFDDQRCKMKFGSWTFSGNMLNLLEGVIVTSTYTQNGEWKLMKLSVVRNEFKYECCPEPYLDLTFELWVRRRTLYYGFNLVIPCLLISFMTLLGFTLPPDSGEKLTLGVTIFMSLIVFLLMVSESLPPTSEAVPLIGIYFSSIMIAVSMSVVFTVIVLNFHHRNPDTHHMPNWARTLLLDWLPWLLVMSRPGYTSKRCELIKNEDDDDDSNDEGITNDNRPFAHSNGTIPTLNSILRLKDSPIITHPYEYQPTANNNNYSMTHYIESPRVHTQDVHRSDEFRQLCQLLLIPLEAQIASIGVDLKYIAKSLKEQERAELIINDWKFAAMVVDKLSLVLFTLIITLSTFGILFSAPYISA